MAKKLKDWYDMEFANFLAEKIHSVDRDFKKDIFLNHYRGNFQDKEFHGRQDVTVEALEKSMSKDYLKNISVFHKILGEELTATEGMFKDGWWLWGIGRYVEKHGIENFEASVDFIKELTKRHTGEFAIRPLLVKYPKEGMKVMETWSRDENVHVRRLASEGVRIRLPWSKKIYVSINEFETYKVILSNLKNDPYKYIQKSVGNNLNDLMKEFPEKALEIINEWKSDNLSKETLWIINHGLRSERKSKKQ